jgi:hypothetical protein
MTNRTTLIVIVGLLGLLIGGLVFLNSFEVEAKDPFKETKAGSFDGERAIKYLEEICKIGPRISGTEGMQKQQDLLVKHFEKHGAKITWQKFEGKQPSQPKGVPMANLIVSWHPEEKRRVILCGHYDTRPIADQETRIADWRKPFVSANDGASTLALMMEMAPLMKDLKLNIGIDFVIFDGEEWIFDRTQDKFFLGSDHFAAEYKKAQEAKEGPKYIAAILLDLFAGKNAKFPYEQNSKFLAGGLLEDFWKTAAEEGVTNFLDEDGPEVLDDHIALNRAGIPAIDIIDFNYAHWHRLSDTPDKCSPVSMAAVAKVFLAWVKKLK